MSDIRQQPDEQLHALNTRITTLVNNCSFQDPQTTETIKIMLLQHTIRYHEARNWIHLQDPAALTYKTLLQHCKLLEQNCKQFRKALYQYLMLHFVVLFFYLYCAYGRKNKQVAVLLLILYFLAGLVYMK